MGINSNLCLQVLDQLKTWGVQVVCVCPGSRNAPLLVCLLEKVKDFQVFYFYEERSAAFFALGKIRNLRQPVAVMTTSGTAAGELLPATMEAYYSGAPLILVTADRPRAYRGSGAPQAAEQVGLFGSYVSCCIDLEGEEQSLFEGFSHTQPYHINVCFEEPLLDLEPLCFERPCLARVNQDLRSDDGEASQRMRKFLNSVKRPFILVGLLQPQERSSVKQLLMKWRVPVYLESLSGLRECEELQSFRVSFPDRLIQRAQDEGCLMDGVIRIGGVPTLRFWRDLESKYTQLAVLSVTRLPFSGLARESVLVVGEISHLMNSLGQCLNFQGEEIQADLQFLFKADHLEKKHLFELLDSEPFSEPALISALSRQIPRGSKIYLGNSLPIREWDLAATSVDRNFDVWASRGLNGIDGQVSTFLGFAESESQNWLILGDLTALYDLPGPWILSQLLKTSVHLVVVNNGGGKIFSRMYSQKEFQNRHQLRFQGWADLWGLSYEQWHQVPQTLQSDFDDPTVVVHRLIELLPDEEATDRFWKKFQAV